MGDKAIARETVKKAGVPIVPGSDGIVESEAEAMKTARSIGYPVIVKAVAGGGGRGMRIAHNDVSFAKEYHIARSEAEKTFGNGAVYIEKYIENPRHIEFQILGDSHGKILHLGERDCSVQRRHQKLIEESPSPFLTSDLRKKMGKAAIRAAAAVEYESAGTIEFLVDPKGHFYFIEANTRIQVEHPVTEEVTGIDLIKQQIHIANGEELDFDQGDVKWEKHAIECRINAEDPGAQLRSLAGHDRPVLRPGRPRRPGRQPRLQRLHDPALLRFDDRKAHLLGSHAQGGAGAHLPRAERIPDPRHQDDDSPPQGDHGRPRLHRGQGHDLLHGGVHEPDDARPVLLENAGAPDLPAKDLERLRAALVDRRRRAPQGVAQVAQVALVGAQAPGVAGGLDAGRKIGGARGVLDQAAPAAREAEQRNAPRRPLREHELSADGQRAHGVGRDPQGGQDGLLADRGCRRQRRPEDVPRPARPPIRCRSAPWRPPTCGRTQGSTLIGRASGRGRSARDSAAGPRLGAMGRRPAGRRAAPARR